MERLTRCLAGPPRARGARPAGARAPASPPPAPLSRAGASPRRQLLLSCTGSEKAPLTREPQNGGVGRDLCGSPSPTPLPKEGHPEQAEQDHVQVSDQAMLD